MNYAIKLKSLNLFIFLAVCLIFIFLIEKALVASLYENVLKIAIRISLTAKFLSFLLFIQNNDS
jgi:hypothetical protein